MTPPLHIAPGMAVNSTNFSFPASDSVSVLSIRNIARVENVFLDLSGGYYAVGCECGNQCGYEPGNFPRGLTALVLHLEAFGIANTVNQHIVLRISDAQIISRAPSAATFLSVSYLSILRDINVTVTNCAITLLP